MKRKKFYRVILAFAMTFAMAFSVVGVPASAAGTSLKKVPNAPSAKVEKASAVKQAGDKSSREDGKDSANMQLTSDRNDIWVSSITVYAACDSGYAPDISNTYNFPYGTWSSIATYEFTQSVKDNLIAKFKTEYNMDANGWYVQITLPVETKAKGVADIYLNLNGQQFPDYPIPIQDGYEETISYYTPTDNSELTGYIRYPDGLTQLISTGTVNYGN